MGNRKAYISSCNLQSEWESYNKFIVRKRSTVLYITHTLLKPNLLAEDNFRRQLLLDCFVLVFYNVILIAVVVIVTFLLYSMLLEQMLKQARLAYHSSLIPRHVTLEGKWLGKSQGVQIGCWQIAMKYSQDI